MFEQVDKFKYLGSTITRKNEIEEEIKVRLKVGNACYFSVTKLLSSHLLSWNLKTRIYKSIVLPTVLYRCQTWPLTLRDEQRLKVFKIRIFGPNKDELTEEFRRLYNAEFRELYPVNIIEVITSWRIKWFVKLLGLVKKKFLNI